MKKVFSAIICLAVVLSFAAFSFPVYAATEGDYEYEVANGGVKIVAYTGAGGEVTIPATLGGYSVTSIDDEAFIENSGLTAVTIPDGVTYIGERAFLDCANLASITVPDGVEFFGVPAIEGTAYYNDAANWEDGVLYIGNYLYEAVADISGEYTVKDGTLCICESAFSSCRELTSVVIPDSVTRIGSFAFFVCPMLTSISIPDSVTRVGAYAFTDTGYYNNDENWEDGVLYVGKILFEAREDFLGACTVKDGTVCITEQAFLERMGLGSLVIPDSVKTIGRLAFLSCTTLVSVEIGNGVEYIGEGAFADCQSLSSAIIKNGVTSITNGMFAGCLSLFTIGIPESVTDIETGAFSGCGMLQIIMIYNKSCEIVYDAANAAINAIPTTVEIYGYAGSTAEAYAEKNGNAFVKFQPSFICVAECPTKTNYFVGDTFDSTGLVVNASYSNGASDTVTASISSPDMTTAGTKTVTVTFEGKETSFDITVNARHLVGDVDLSDGITIADALTLFKHVAGVANLTDSDALTVADIDGKNGITIADALTLFKFVAGVISEL